MGRDLLGQDYILKQLSSSLTHPDTPIGKAYWSMENRKSKIEIGEEFNKIWIVPSRVKILESGTMAYVEEAALKVLTEADYMAKQSIVGSDLSLLVEQITKDVNSGENFAKLRQIYHSLVLATWFKQKFFKSFYKNYIDKNKISGIDSVDPKIKNDIWTLYVESFKKGTYNLIKKEKNSQENKKQMRHYFAGGFKSEGLKRLMATERVVSSDISEMVQGEGVKYTVQLSQSLPNASFLNEEERYFKRKEYLLELYDELDVMIEELKVVGQDQDRAEYIRAIEALFNTKIVESKMFYIDQIFDIKDSFLNKINEFNKESVFGKGDLFIINDFYEKKRLALIYTVIEDTETVVTAQGEVPVVFLRLRDKFYNPKVLNSGGFNFVETEYSEVFLDGQDHFLKNHGSLCGCTKINSETKRRTFARSCIP